MKIIISDDITTASLDREKHLYQHKQTLLILFNRIIAALKRA